MRSQRRYENKHTSTSALQTTFSLQTRLDSGSANGHRGIGCAPAAAKPQPDALRSREGLQLLGGLGCSFARPETGWKTTGAALLALVSVNTSALLHERDVHACRSPLSSLSHPSTPRMRLCTRGRRKAASEDTKTRKQSKRSEKAILTHSAGSPPPSRGVSSPAPAPQAVAVVAMATAEG